MTFLPAPPEVMRAVWMEVFYDRATEPSIAAPCLDFFGLPHGRPAEFYSALMAASEGRGFNSYLPMPFDHHVRIEFTNSSAATQVLYFQIDYTLERGRTRDGSYLHAQFRRENPTVMKRDFVILDDVLGPGRLFGCNIGIRVIDPCDWYGEGEVKVYKDGDTDLPTICGTGFEDYVGTAWGLGQHYGPYSGAPLVVSPPATPGEQGSMFGAEKPEFVGVYRWHLLDPIMFERSLRVTIQQIGAAFFAEGQQDEFDRYNTTNPPAGRGWTRDIAPGMIATGITERVDDYCATAYYYLRQPQPVPRLDLDLALADIERRPYEQASPFEVMWRLSRSPSRQRPG
jgi:hypothetical protein